MRADVTELQFVAVAAGYESSEVSPALGAAVDPQFVAALAKAHDDAGFDAVLAHDSGSSVDAAVLAGQVLAASRRMRVLLRTSRSRPSSRSSSSA